MRIAINGFGRIGKNFLRSLMEDPQAKKKIEVVAINLGPGKKENTAHMFKYDTLMGMYKGDVKLEGDYLIIDDKKIKLLTEIDPLNAPWKKLKIDWVVDCSGTCTQRDRACRHLEAGAKAVVISAPCHDEDVTIIPGINDKKFKKGKDKIVALGSCTTNALVPMLKVLKEKLGFCRGFMTTIHAYTNSQVLLDRDDKDLRRSRAAALNIIPTTTGASKTVDKVLPELAGRIPGIAMRVPVPNVSIVEIVFTSDRELSEKEINKAFNHASQTSLKSIMGYTTEPLVSSDFAGTHYSVVVDGSLTQVCGNLGKVFGWYDNEWGYSQRLKDFLLFQ